MLSFKAPLLLQVLTALGASRTGIATPTCKTIPGDPGWPSQTEWSSLNTTICGQLLQPAPVGAVCHPSQPAYNASLCSIVMQEWFQVDFFSQDPSASAWPFWNNDSCLPFPGTPCSAEGYPVYIVNATTTEHVKAGVDFARMHNVRLVVKATGHDYLGRMTAPNSLSIWVHNMNGITFQDKYTPQGCKRPIESAAITFAAGTEMGELNQAANSKNLTILSGGQESVGYGGYATGAGHAALSPTYGLAADNILEMEIVSPGGDILTINECQNQDLFWAMRGGGGSTFGIITSTTIKAFPSTPFLTYTVLFGTSPNSSAFWDAMTYFVSQYPLLAEHNLAGYGGIYPNTTLNSTNYGGFQGVFVLPVLSPSNTTSSVEGILAPILNFINSTWPNEFAFQTESAEYSSFYDWWLLSNGPDNGGIEILVGSRLLDAQALSGDLVALRTALQGFTPPGGASMVYLVGGKGVRDVVPRGGSDAVNPAWRKALVHMTNGVTWTYLNATEKAQQENLLTNHYVEALRKLAPNSGAYVNEADPHEPNFQQAFWGDNYERLLKIKRSVDPGDVFWCTPCVGNERWKNVEDRLCKVPS